MPSEQGVTDVDHYLNNFVTMGPPNSPVCEANLQIILSTCAELGVPLTMEKLEGPTHCITCLGIEVNTQSGTMRLPREKLIGHFGSGQIKSHAAGSSWKHWLASSNTLQE